METITSPAYDRLQAMWDIMDGMTLEEKQTLNNFILGYVSESVPAEKWRQALDAGLANTLRDRRRTVI